MVCVESQTIAKGSKSPALISVRLISLHFFTFLRQLTTSNPT
jgi:hypothetical protein